MLARPTSDVVCLLTNSLRPEVRRQHLDEFLRVYYDHLINCMETHFAYKNAKEIYSYEDLVNDYKTNYGHGFYWGIANGWVIKRLKFTDTSFDKMYIQNHKELSI